MLLILGVVVALIVVGAGIFLATKFFLGGDGPKPAVIAPSQIPKPQPPKMPPPVTPPVPAQPTPATMSPEDLLKAARSAEGEKDFAKAIGLYQEILGRQGGGLNTEAAAGIAGARAEYQRQQEENLRNEKFLKDYQFAVKSFRAGEFSECLRVSWRLIYPDDTMARQLGKRDAVAKLIRDGYYNWAVMDLKGQNPSGADKNLKDLLDFDKGDAEARKLQVFVKKYLKAGPDDNYRDAVKGLTYRPFTENP